MDESGDCPHQYPLFVTEEEAARRIGISVGTFRRLRPMLERQGMPQRNPLFANRRYWPAVRAWFDRREGVGTVSIVAEPFTINDV